MCVTEEFAHVVGMDRAGGRAVGGDPAGVHRGQVLHDVVLRHSLLVVHFPAGLAEQVSAV